MAAGKKKNGRKEGLVLPSVLTRNTIMRMAGPVYFGRGEGYFEARLVGGLVEYEDRITARVRGTSKYDVSLWVEGGGLAHSCTCPLGEDGEFCKHCVATGLKWLKQQEDQGGRGRKSRKARVSFKDVRNYLLTQEKQSLVETILEQARGDGHSRQRLLAKTARASSKGLDLDAFRAAIDYALEFDDYVDYRSLRYYARSIEEAISPIEDLLKEGHAPEAIGLAEHALAAVEGALNHVDDSGGQMGDILHWLQEIHLRACKKAKPDPEELARRLFHWELNSPWEVFYGAAETYKNVLGKKGLAVYSELAQAEWERLPELKPGSDDHEKWGTKRFRITGMMESLARQTGDVEELVRVKSRDLSSPYCFLKIAEAYRKARKFGKALSWAERGVKSFPKRPDSRLLEFLAGEYRRAKRHGEAMDQIWAIFTDSPGLDNYKLLKTHADKTGAWPAWREKALSYIRERFEEEKAERGKERWGWFKPDNSALVEIFLWEKDIEAAWRVAQKDGCRNNLWLELAKKREKDFPQDALGVYQRMIEPTIEQKAYKEAVSHIKKVSALMERLGRKEEFSEHLDSIRAVHKRKRNFIKLLEGARSS